MKRLQNKNALLTGANRGIGFALAQALLEEGVELWLHARSLESARCAAKKLGSNRIHPVSAELTSKEQLQKLCEKLRGQTTRLDILVNNAGFEVRSSMLDIGWQDYRQIMQVNLEAPLFLTQKLFPLLQKAGGDSVDGASIVNVSSVHESLPCSKNGAYSMSKAAMKMLTQTLAIELAQYNIRVNNLSPGAIETDMNREIITAIGREKFNNWIAAGRLAKAEELKEPLIFLASSASSYMTGESLIIDGGLSKNLVPYARNS